MEEFLTLDEYVSPHHADDLVKAVEAGQITGRDTTNLRGVSGAATKMESLDRNIKFLAEQLKDMRLVTAFPKKPVANTVNQYIQELAPGQYEGAFLKEGEIPEEDEAQLVQRASFVKFMGDLRRISHPAMVVDHVNGQRVQYETERGIINLHKKWERNLLYADSKIAQHEFDGLYAQHQHNDIFGGDLDRYFEGDYVIDKRGNSLTEADFEDAAEIITENFGVPDMFVSHPRPQSGFAKTFYGQKFIVPNSPQVTDGVVGQRVRQITSQFGDINMLNSNLIQSQRPRLLSDGPSSREKSPAAPVPDPTTPAAATGDPNNKWATFEDDYRYAVAAMNRFGSSELVELTASPLTVASGQSVDLTFTAATSGSVAEGFIVYRTERGAASLPAGSRRYYPLFRISKTDLGNGYDGAAAGSVRDRNRIIPNTEQGYLSEFNLNVQGWAQLLPMQKVDLPQSAYIGMVFAIVLYGTPELYAPTKMVRFVNIGR